MSQATNQATNQNADQSTDQAGGLPGPDSVDNLYAWLRADDVLLNSGNVETWNDLSGNSRTATQTTSGFRASYNASVAGFNNKPTATFDGIDDLYAINWLSSVITTGGAFTVFAVHDNGDGTGGTDFLWCSGQSSFTNYMRVGRTTGDFFVFFERRVAALDQKIGSTSLGANANYSTISYGGTGNNGDLRVNGADDIADWSTAEDPTVTDGTLGASVLNVTSGFWSGDVAEFIVYNRKLTDEEIDTVEAYLANRYGL